MACPCAETPHERSGSIIDRFARIRQSCSALKDLLLPDCSWEMLVAEESKARNPAQHSSYLLQAYECGCLDKITGPAHRFLFQGTALHPSLTSQYRNDLQERWLAKTNPCQRNKRFREFFGKIVELQLADLLTVQGWRVTGLEALGAHADIVADSPTGKVHSFEVKYIGMRDEAFREMLKDLVGAPSGGATSYPRAANYLLLRAYDAARQLRSCTNARCAIVVVEGQGWNAFRVPLQDGWIKWDRPAFLLADSKWDEWLDKQRQEKYPALDAELVPTIRSLDELWIMRLDPTRYEYSCEYVLTPGNAIGEACT